MLENIDILKLILKIMYKFDALCNDLGRKIPKNPMKFRIFTNLTVTLGIFGYYGKNE